VTNCLRVIVGILNSEGYETYDLSLRSVLSVAFPRASDQSEETPKGRSQRTDLQRKKNSLNGPYAPVA